MTGNTWPDGITQTLQLYFDGLYDSDTALLAQAFHASATIIGYGGDGQLKIMSRAEFLGFVKTVASAKAAGTEYDMEILSVDVSGSIAAAKVRDLYLNRNFTDYLHLADGDDGWKIIGKAFHSEAR